MILVRRPLRRHARVLCPKNQRFASQHPRAPETPLPGRQQDILLLRNLLLTPPAPSLIQRAVPGKEDNVANNDDDDDDDPHKTQLHRLLRAADTRVLYDWLVPHPGRTGSPTDEEARRYRAVAGLPPTSFSALLRLLHPEAVYAARDDAQEMVVTPGLAQFTPLGAAVDRFGVRVVYRALLRALLGVVGWRSMGERRAGGGGGHPLLLHDYMVLLASAGAAADPATAKRVWHEMEARGLVRWRQAGAYAAFAQARFLTEALSLQQDTARLRVRPGNLDRQKLALAPARMQQLERLRRAQERDPVSRWGQRRGDDEDEDDDVVDDDVVESLTRVLRKTRPVYRVLRKAEALGVAHDERLLAALVVALGRTGSLAAVERLLASYWQVRVVRERRPGPGGGSVVVDVRGGVEVAPDSALRPTARLLAAVVQAYGCHGEVACALQVAGFLARRYGLALPPRVWHDLLAWTYLQASRPVADEWRLAGFPGRVLRPRTLAVVWRAMVGGGTTTTKQVSLSQHHLLVKMLLAQRRLATALQLMRAARPLYQARLRAHADALLAHAAAERLGDDSAAAAATAATSARLARAAARKWHMRYCLQVWCRAFLRAARPRAHDDPVAVRLVPQMVEAFWPFLPLRGRDRRSGVVRYRTVAGVVELREAKETRESSMAVHVRYTTAVVDLPAVRPSRVPLADDDEAAALPFSVSFETDADDNHFLDPDVAQAEPYVVEQWAAVLARATAEAEAAVDAATQSLLEAAPDEARAAAAATHHLRQQRRLLRQRQQAEERLHAQRLVRDTALRRRIWIRTATTTGPLPTERGTMPSRAWLLREFA